jgi:rod shape-determining protein MreC
VIDPAARRRRRLILAALVVVSLVLITAGFGASGGSSGGPVGALGEGASKIAKPVRDLVRWFGDTADAKGDVEDLRKETARLRAENGDLRARQNRIPQIQRLLQFDASASLRISSMDPVTAAVVGQSPTAWASTIRIDKGSTDGIEVDQPVVGPQGAGAGLVGFVTTVRASSSVVTMLPTPGQSIGAKLEGRGTVLTVQGAGAGTSTDLELQYAPSSVSIKEGALVVTSGTNVDPNAPESKAPAGIPIGRITSVSKAGEDGQVGHLRPLVDLKALEVVQVLTKRVDGNRPAPPVPGPSSRSTSTTPPATTTTTTPSGAAGSAGTG